MLVSSVLCNSEVWFNLTSSDLDLLETVDLMLLRRILDAPKSTPKEMMFLELGVVPLRDIIRQRRLNYLKYILDQEADSMLFKVFEKQSQNRTKKDWITTALADLELLDLTVTFAEIQEMNKLKWKSMVKQSMKEKSLKQLEVTKQKHSKVNKLKHPKLEIQKYFLPNEQAITKEEIQLIFKIRSRGIRVKVNLKGLYDSYECEVCQNEEETQKHIYECQEIWKMKEYHDENPPEYENIMIENVKEKLEIARIFKENLEIYEKMKIKK